MPGVVGHRLHVDEDVAGDGACSAAVAVIEGDDVGEVVVSEVLTVHFEQPLGRAEDIVDLGERVALLLGHAPQPRGGEPFLRQPVGASVGMVSYSHCRAVFTGLFAETVRGAHLLGSCGRIDAEYEPVFGLHGLDVDRGADDADRAVLATVCPLATLTELRLA